MFKNRKAHLDNKCFSKRNAHTKWTIIWPWGYSGLNYSFILLCLKQVQDFDTSFNTDAIRLNQFAVRNTLHWLSFKNEPSIASAVGRRLGRQPFCILGKGVSSRVTVRWRKMTLHPWWHSEGAGADSYPNSFPCRFPAQSQSRSHCVLHSFQWPLPIGPLKRGCQRKRTLYT